ncbi:MAG: hypothetical protein HC876_21570 [Chloroflexaceae bacterium]|nr:hypothetical protein [bacterium]NJO07894.1 hypothetical protein [Chloroflexaceae bacterium]NJO84802.1 hypothetical protein [Blastochloris sp.]
MISHLERYRSGERTQAWRELVAFGAAVREEPLYSDARAVAEEIMQRISFNLHLILKRLVALEFQFTSGWSAPDKRLLTELEAIEHYGTLPLVVDCWFRNIGQISLSGFHPRLSYDEGNADVFPDAIGPNTDPLEVAFVSFSHEDPEDHEDNEPAYVCIADGLTVPLSSSFDAPFNSYYFTGTFFIPYLQTCFDWGGFPGLRHYPEAAERAREELAFLKEGLLPLL